MCAMSRMVERGEHLRFAAEPRQAFGIAGDRRQQHLDRDVAVERGIPAAIHLAHAAAADQRPNVSIISELAPG